ncbi:helicase and polymerase-containing TEBICHI [Micractinium conductrix]|uniref:Helicase and polymerase-containing TEBICHI n=1 Tax=Micractinium conductrix TaxID=554055 RepID=A0A2P6V734_9CHLO|nr:helicase and polymerase-containing TEBICHI [Micractinium conductrix]|eukprot:PSC69888.1 helicase and polymerase-containing TEBICHI [Micractinium conductrix]
MASAGAPTAPALSVAAESAADAAHAPALEAWWGSAPAELLVQIFACLPLKDRCLTACAVNAWWREVALEGTATLLLDLNLNRLPLFAQRTRSLPDFYPQRSSFITWLLARRRSIRRLALTAERWEDDSQAVMLRLGVAEIVASQLTGLRLVCTDSGRTTSAFLAGGGRLQELALDFWGQSKGLPRALEGCTALTKLSVQCSGGLEQYKPLASLKSLQDLSVADCDWQKLPAEVAQLPLTRLQLRFADFGNDAWLPAGLGRLCSTLRDLALPGCQIRAIPEGITALSALTALTLDRNFFVVLPPWLAQLRSLQHLSCEGCSGLRKLPPALAASLPLRHLNLLHTGVLRLPLAAGAAGWRAGSLRSFARSSPDAGAARRLKAAPPLLIVPPPLLPRRPGTHLALCSSSLCGIPGRRQRTPAALPQLQRSGITSGPIGGGPLVQRAGARASLRLRLAEWGLPPGVVQAFEAKGVKSMYPWQAAAVECGEQFNNLVYCAPTSGGKSLVAEVLMVRRLMLSLQHIPQQRRSKPKYGRALVVLPYVSIVSEKAEHLAQVLAPMHASVKGFYGAEEKGQALAPRGETVACCTIEKANVAINRLAQEGRLGELCCVVVDELHMVGDGERGVGLEMSLSKLLFSPAAQHVQIVGMSATMGGLEHLRAWLRAELFLTNFRPVPLSEHAIFRGKVYEKIGPQELATLEEGTPPLREVREVAPSDPRRDADRLVPLVAEVTTEGHSVLVFCSTRKACEAAAVLIADLLPQISPTPEPERAAELAAQRQSICQDVKIAMGGAMSGPLEACMLQGVAWHHAGLTAEERTGVERAYRCGAITVITATSTLAAGINLPARRVILRSLHQGIGPVARSQYLQMVGRAGRAGHSAVGESFLIGKGAANGQEWHQICGLLTAPVPCLESRLLALEGSGKPAPIAGASGRASGGAASAGAFNSRSVGAAALTPPATQHLQQLLLEGVANGTVREGADVGRLVCSTLAAQQQGVDTMRAASKVALRALMEQKRLVQAAPEQPGILELTPKGRAVYDSALPLEAAMQLYDSCKHADDGFVLDSPLVLLYHCLLSHPFQIVSWAEWGRALASLNKQEQHIAESVGVHVMHVHAAQSGRTPSADVQERHSKFAAAVALSELTQEKDIQGVVAKWGREGFVSKAGLSRGQVQKLQQDAGKWMGMASLLCESAGWWPLATLYGNLSQMAAAGVRQDLLPLMRIPGMDAGKARALYKAGLRDAQMLATADEQAVARALAPAIATQMRGRSSAGKQSGGMSASSAANYAAASMSARAATTLVKGARNHLRRQMTEFATLVDNIQEDEAAEVVERTGGGGGGGGAMLTVADVPRLAAITGQQRQQPASVGGAAAGEELSAEELAQIRHEVAQLGDGAGGQAGGSEQALPEVTVAPAAQLCWTQGTIKVTELRPRTPAQHLEEFFALWRAQPRFALALHTLSHDELSAAAAGLAAGPPPTVASGRRPGSAGVPPTQRLQGLAVCWDLRQSFFLELTAAHCERVLRSRGAPGGGNGATVLDAVRAVLAQATQKVCYGALELLPELMQQGMQLGGSLEDPRLAGALLWPGATEEGGARLDLKRMQAAVVPAFKARVPNLCRSGVTLTCRTAVLTLACANPLKQMLGQRGMLETFLHLESPAALALLHINASPTAPRLAPPALAAALAQAQQCAGLAQGVVRQLYCMPQLDLGSIDTQMQLLGSLKQPLPERPKRGRPTVSLDHLQELLHRCRPHQQRERDMLALLVQHRAVSEQVAKPLQALLEVSALAAAPAAPALGSQAAQQRPGSAGSAAIHPAAEPAAAAAQQQQQATPISTALLLRADVLHVELAVLAHLSGQPELQQCCAEAAEAAGSGGVATLDAYQRLGHCWAAAAGRLDVPGTGAPGSPPVLVCGGTAAAVVHSLVHAWSPNKLGWVLRCSKHDAGLVLDSLLAAFPALQAWLAEAAAAGEAACSAATLAGRQRQFAALKRADDAMGRGKLHKAILQHVLAGSLADVTKAALVAVHAALASLGQQASAAAGAAAPAARSPSCRSLASQQLGMEPEAGVAYPLHLGASLLGQRGAPEAAGGAADEFCTLRYDFKPASAARAAVGQMDVQMASQKVSLQMEEASFSGKYEPSRDGLDCVAIFDGTSFRLELLGASIKNLRHMQGGARGGSAFQAATAAAPLAAAAPGAAEQESQAVDAGASMLLEDELMRAFADEGFEEEEEDGGEAGEQQAAAAAGAAVAAAGGGEEVSEEEISEEEASEDEEEEEEEEEEGAVAAARRGAAEAAAPLLPAAPSMPQEEMNDLDRMFFGFDGGMDAPEEPAAAAAGDAEDGEDGGSSGADEEI